MIDLKSSKILNLVIPNVLKMAADEYSEELDEPGDHLYESKIEPESKDVAIQFEAEPETDLIEPKSDKPKSEVKYDSDLLNQNFNPWEFARKHPNITEGQKIIEVWQQNFIDNKAGTLEEIQTIMNKWFEQYKEVAGEQPAESEPIQEDQETQEIRLPQEITKENIKNLSFEELVKGVSGKIFTTTDIIAAGIQLTPEQTQSLRQIQQQLIQKDVDKGAHAVSDIQQLSGKDLWEYWDELSNESPENRSLVWKELLQEQKQQIVDLIERAQTDAQNLAKADEKVQETSQDVDYELSVSAALDKYKYKRG